MGDYIKIQVIVAAAGVILLVSTGKLLFLLACLVLAPPVALIVRSVLRAGGSLFYGTGRPDKRSNLGPEFTMAEVWRHKEAYDKAVAAYERILEQDLANMEAHIKMARILREDLHDYACALRAYGAVLRPLENSRNPMPYIEAREGVDAIRSRDR